jgi:phospholipase C
MAPVEGAMFMPARLGTLFLLLLVIGVGAVACTNAGNIGAPVITPQEHHRSSPSTPIAHVVIIIQENRSFDNFFSTFPGANGTTVGEAIPMPTPIAQACAAKGQQVITSPTTVPLTEVSLVGKGFPTTPPSGSSPGQPYGWNNDPPYTYLGGYLGDCNSASGQPNASSPCQMNGFDAQLFGPDDTGPGPICTYTYQYVNPSDIAPYWNLAKQYVLADNIFQSQGSSSFTGHQDLIAAGTSISETESAIDNPGGMPWGCDSPSNVAALTVYGKYIQRSNGHPACYPVYSSYPYETMRDLLDAASVSWKFYANKVYPAGNPKSGTSGIWSGFDAISSVRYGNEWGTNVVWPDTKILGDITNGTLPAVSWVTPDGANSDHPQQNCKCDKGPSWVASIVNKIGESNYWKTTAIVVVWDDFGGFYDHVPPPFYDDQGGLGFRIPMLIISPYVKPHVEHTQYETASILKFVEQNWALGSLDKLDARAKNSIGNAFDFSMSPRKFKKIPSKYPLSFFLHQKPSGLPPDTE